VLIYIDTQIFDISIPRQNVVLYIFRAVVPLAVKN